jgi:hypothetical protein
MGVLGNSDDKPPTSLVHLGLDCGRSHLFSLALQQDNIEVRPEKKKKVIL